MSEELKPCPFCGNAPQIDQGLVSCPLCRMTWIPPNMWNTRRADLARPAPAEGAVKPLEWDDRNRAQGYRVQPTYGQDRKPYILTRDGKIIWAYDTIDDAKAEAQADWERRILSALASPEDATPAAPVSVEEAAKVLLDAYTSEVCEVDFNPAWEAYQRANGTEDVRAYEGMEAFLRALAQQDRRAALREMQSIREEIEQESGHDH